MKIYIDARYVRTSDTEVLPSGGIGRYAYQLLSNLLELDEKLRLLLCVPSTNRRPIVLGEHAGRVRELKFSAPPHSLRTLLAFPRVAEVPDLWHFPANVLPFGARRPSIATIHDLMWLDEPKLCASSSLKRLVTGSYYRLAIEHAARHAGHILTVSETSKQALVTRFPELASRITVTHHGLEPFFSPISAPEAEAATARLVAPGVPFVLCVGQGSPYKNHPRALRGFSLAFGSERELKLVLVRRFTRSDQEMRRLLKSPELAGRVITLQEVNNVELRALYTRARIFLFPSLFEGFGLPALEAMACGTPVLTANFGAMAEVSGDAALGVDTHSVEAIGAGLRRLHEDEELRAELRTRGFSRAAQFSWRSCAARTLNVYRSAL